MSDFAKIITFDDGPVGYEFTSSGHIKMKNHPYPYSIMDQEFSFLTSLIEKYRKHIKEPLDFVFIDAGHFEKQMIKDIDSILPLLGEKYVLAFHDVYPWSFTDNVHKHLFDKIGKNVEIVIKPPHGENFGIVVNV